jgi:hypothetical protein
MRDYIQLLSVIGAIVLGIYSAWSGKWEITGSVITGLFAIINFSPKEKKNEIPTTDNTPTV